MKENNDIDKLLRASLENYTPAPASSGKEKFLEEAAALTPADRRSGILRRPFIIVIILVAILGTIGWYLATTLNDVVPANETRLTPDSIEDDLSVKAQEPSGQNGSETARYTESFKAENNNITIEKKETDISRKSSEPVPEKSIIALKNPSSPVPVVKTSEMPQLTAEISDSPPSSTGPFSSAIAEANLLDSTIITKSNTLPAGQILMKPADTVPTGTTPPPRPKGGMFMTGLFYNFEKLCQESSGNRPMHSIGAEFQYRSFSPKYLIRVGVGISISPGYYDYGVNYNEFLGTYDHLDSVTFILAADNFHLVPNYHETQREVFDTAIQTDYLTTDKRFEYLYIPVMMGYDFIRRDHFTFGLEAGPSLSVLLNKKPATPDVILGRNQVVQVNLLTPLRNEMIWKLSAGLNFTFLSKDNYYFELEPGFSWYFDQLTGDENGRQYPYSLGLRIAAGIIPKKAEFKK